MKVLMFGWEFPPHISGGLGTACFGLTSSLNKENIDVLFVVPKLHGGEFAENTNFISASTIPVNIQNDLEKYILPASVHSSGRPALFNILKKDASIRHIEIPSSLSPYRSPGFKETSKGIEYWNYSFSSMSDQRVAQSASSREKNLQKTETDEVSYQFSGSYGPGLLEEVKRYAQVAAVLAGKFEFDVIHAHDWMTYLAGIAAKKVSGKPLIVHVHATEYDRSGEYVDEQIRAIELQGMTDADCVVTVSNWTKNMTVSRYGISEEKIKVVHNGIIPKSPSIRKSSAPPVGSHIITFLGRITHQKGPLYFVEAARKVLDRIPDAHFVVAGSGDLLPLMIERIAQLRLSSHFHFTGFLRGEDVNRVWRMSDVYVMPSVSEPFGIAPLEAIQAGVPVIISKQSGVAEVMPHAIKADFWNIAELAEAICSVLKYKSLSRTLALNSAAEISDISWNAAAKKLTKLYYGLTTKQLTT